jgi:hypothetical protein
VVFEEKRREDLLRAEGLRVVRWVWDELARFELVVPRLRRALSAGAVRAPVLADAVGAARTTTRARTGTARDGAHAGGR